MLPRRRHRGYQAREQIVGLQHDGSRAVLPYAFERISRD